MAVITRVRLATLCIGDDPQPSDSLGFPSSEMPRIKALARIFSAAYRNVRTSFIALFTSPSHSTRPTPLTG